MCFIIFFKVRLFYLFIGIFFLFGCTDSAPENKNTASLLQKVVENEQERFVEKSATLELTIQEENEAGILAVITLLNPEKKDIQSVQSWVAFPPRIVEGILLEHIETSPFLFEAPGEFMIDNENGLVKISVSKTSKEPTMQKRLDIAKIVFRKNNDTPFQLDFFDKGENGKTRVFILDDGKLVDILR